MSHVLRLDENNSLTDTRSNPFGKLSREFMDDSAQVLRVGRGLRSATQPFKLGQSFFESLELDGFDQIINRVHLEGIQSESVECGRKNDCRLFRKLLEKFESRHPGHLNIEKNGIDLMVREKLNSLGRLYGRTDDLHAVRLTQQPGQTLQCQGFIVDQVYTQKGHFLGAGSEICTVVPASSRGNSTAAFEPHNASSRSFKLCSPCPAGSFAFSGKPLPESQTRSTSRPSPFLALTRISPPPYFTLFSTRVCKLKGGTGVCIRWPGTSMKY